MTEVYRDPDQLVATQGRTRHPYRLASPSNCRTSQQAQLCEVSNATGRCQFCAGGSAFDVAEFVELPDEAWASHVDVLFNTWPHEGSDSRGDKRCHWVIVPKSCVACLTDLPDQEFLAIKAAVKWPEQRFDLTHHVLYTRGGDPDGACTTITHVHAQLVSVKPGGFMSVGFGTFPKSQ